MFCCKILNFSNAFLSFWLVGQSKKFLHLWPPPLLLRRHQGHGQQAVQRGRVGGGRQHVLRRPEHQPRQPHLGRRLPLGDGRGGVAQRRVQLGAAAGLEVGDAARREDEAEGGGGVAAAAAAAAVAALGKVLVLGKKENNSIRARNG